MDVIFDLTGTTRVAGDPRPRGFAVGTMTVAVRVEQTGPEDLLGVRFRSGAARAFLRPPASELTDRFSDVEALWGGAGRELWQRLGEAPGTPERLELLRTALERRLDPSRPDRIVRRAADLLRSGRTAAGVTATVAGVAAHLGVSRRHLERRFDAEVGISPGTLLRVGRLERAVGLLGRGGRPGLGEVAVRAGYHDQPHMTRDFRALAGVTPGAYRREIGRWKP